MKELEPVIDTLSKGIYYDMSKLPPPPATTALLNEDPIYSQLTAAFNKQATQCEYYIDYYNKSGDLPSAKKFEEYRKRFVKDIDSVNSMRLAQTKPTVSSKEIPIRTEK